MASRAPDLRPELLDALVELLAEVDTAPAAAFYDRICEAVCRLSSMERAALFLYDDERGYVRAYGSHALPREMLEHIHATIEETPIAQRSLEADRVLTSREDPAHGVPARYSGLLGITTLTCIPVSASGRWFGVVLADRGGGHFDLLDSERHVMWTVGKLAALASSARIATRQQERARRLSEQVELAREIHERVMHRLFGVNLALGADGELTRAERDRCRSEMSAALVDLRTALERPLAPRSRVAPTTLRAALARIAERNPGLGLQARFEGDGEVPADLEPLAQSVLSEALRNAARHAAPTRVDVAVTTAEDSFVLEVRNDGVRDSPGGHGMGLRLAAMEALQRGGVLEWGAIEPGSWRVRLVVPL